jgi:hypothetical protein
MHKTKNRVGAGAATFFLPEPHHIVARKIHILIFFGKKGLMAKF